LPISVYKIKEQTDSRTMHASSFGWHNFLL